MMAVNIDKAIQYLKCKEFLYSYTLFRKRESFSERSAQKKRRDNFLSFIDRLKIFYFCDLEVDIQNFYSQTKQSENRQATYNIKKFELLMNAYCNILLMSLKDFQFLGKLGTSERMQVRAPTRVFTKLSV